MALDGQWFVVGEQVGELPLSDPNIGVVYIYQQMTPPGVMQHEASMIAIAPQPDARFGGAVAISGNTIVVGAKFFDQGGLVNAGTAYVFELDDGVWEQVQILRAGTVQTGAQFGHAVAIDGDRIVVGAHFEDTAAGTKAGVVYAYQWNPEIEEWPDDPTQTLLEPLAGQGYEFGWSVAIDGDLLIVGAPGDVYDNSTEGPVGRAYIFSHDGSSWDLPETLVRGSGGDHFGKDVAIQGDIAVVSAHGVDVVPMSDANEGAAYVFRHDPSAGPGMPSWRHEVRLLPCSLDDQGESGWSVDLAGDTLVVGGHPGHPLTGETNVYRFLGQGWARVRTLGDESEDPLVTGRYGWAVATDGDAIVVGDPEYISAGAGHSGRIYTAFGIGSATACDCPTDLDNDGATEIDDVEIMFTGWGVCQGCPFDFDDNGYVDGDDLQIMLDAWSHCADPGGQEPPKTLQDCIDDYGHDPNRLATCVEMVLGL